MATLCLCNPELTLSKPSLYSTSSSMLSSVSGESTMDPFSSLQNSKNSSTVNPRFLFFPCCLKANVLPPYFFCMSLSPGSWWDLPSCSTANPNCPNLQQKQISQHPDMRIYKVMVGIFSAFSWDRNSWSSRRGDSTSSAADGKWIKAHLFPELSVQAFPCVTKEHRFCLPWETSQRWETSDSICQ